MPAGHIQFSQFSSVQSRRPAMEHVEGMGREPTGFLKELEGLGRIPIDSPKDWEGLGRIASKSLRKAIGLLPKPCSSLRISIGNLPKSFQRLPRRPGLSPAGSLNSCYGNFHSGGMGGWAEGRTDGGAVGRSPGHPPSPAGPELAARSPCACYILYREVPSPPNSNKTKRN